MNRVVLTSIIGIVVLSVTPYVAAKQYPSLNIHGVHHATQTLTDYSGISKSTADYYEASPSDQSQVIDLVKTAYARNIPIRMQGNSHSQSGISLPRKKELLLHTNQLNKVIFDQEGEVYAEAGVPMLMLKHYLEENTGYTLPVTNEGGVGPTVGGFISAGGISYKSSMYGGFWNNVIEVNIVTANGKLQKIKRDDKVFPWLFGSMGQLGVITGARLKLTRDVYKPISHYPQGKVQTLAFSHEDYASRQHDPLYWFNIFVPIDRADTAREQLEVFQNTIADKMNLVPIYSWTVQTNDFSAPLLSPLKAFVAMGVWGTAKNRQDILKINKQFTVWAKERKFKRYIQAELTASPDFFKDYFGSKVYKKFDKLKQRFDPKFLFNQDTVFVKKV